MTDTEKKLTKTAILKDARELGITITKQCGAGPFKRPPMIDQETLLELAAGIVALWEKVNEKEKNQ